MSKRLAAMLCIVHFALCAAAQHDVQRAILFGAGVANSYDTYLSPLEYRGPHMQFVRESLRMTHWKHIATQGTFSISALYTHNQADNAHAMGSTVAYRQSWFYTWTPSKQWTLQAGGGAGGHLGFLYNMRNSANNPAQAQLDAALHASAAATWRWRWLALRAQMDAPLLGLMFSPHYGQSYYEIFSLGHSDRNVVFTHPANCPSFCATLMADFRIPHFATLRLGYGADIQQSRPNGLRRHTYMHTGYVGIVRNFKLL